MQRRAKTRIGAAAITLVYSLLAFPLTAHASPGAGSNWMAAGGTAYFGSSGWCDETGVGGIWGNYSAQDNHGFYALRDLPFTAATTAGIPTGMFQLCGEMSRQPSDDTVLGAVGAACDTGGELVAGVPAPTGRNGFGRIIYDSGSALGGHYHQLWDVRMAFTPASGMVFRGEYTSSPGMPNASTGTAVINAQMGNGSPIGNNCLLLLGTLMTTFVYNGSFVLIPD